MSKPKLIIYTIILAVIPIVITGQLYDEIYIFVSPFVDVNFSSLGYLVSVWAGAFLISAYLLFRIDELFNPPRKFSKRLSKLERKVTRLQGDVFFLTVEQAEIELEDCYDLAVALRGLARKHDLAPSEKQLNKMQNISSQVQFIESNIRDRKFGIWKHILRRIFQIIGILSEIIAILFPSAGLTISRAARIGQYFLGRDDDPRLPPGAPGGYLE